MLELELEEAEAEEETGLIFSLVPQVPHVSCGDRDDMQVD